MKHESFRIGFDPRDRKKVLDCWGEIFLSQKWTEGKFTRLFEEKWEAWNGLPAVAMSSWAGGAMACREYFNLRSKKVLCPTNTFMATPLSAAKAGAEIVFADCNRTDLCLSYEAAVNTVVALLDACQLSHIRTAKLNTIAGWVARGIKPCT